MAKTKRKSGINIKPQNKGKLRRTAKKTKSGNVKVSELQRMKKSKDPKVRKRATFALNARQWNKGGKKS